MSTPVLELFDVSAAYSTYRALFGVTFSVPEGAIVALIGSNGAGKSTVARVVSGLVPVAGGTVRVAGEDVTKLSAHRIAQRGLAHVPEGRAVFSTLSVEENLTLSFHRRVGRRGTAEALARAYEAFPVLAERRRQQGGTLSGGQQRILSLAKVLAVPPKLLIVDELSLGLAPVIVDQVYEGLVAIHDRGCALLVVEQQVDRALAIADGVVMLAKGAVAWQGSAADARAVMEESLAGSNGTSSASNGRHAERAAAIAVAVGPVVEAVATHAHVDMDIPPVDEPAPTAPTAPAPAPPAPDAGGGATGARAAGAPPSTLAGSPGAVEPAGLWVVGPPGSPNGHEG